MNSRLFSLIACISLLVSCSKQATIDELNLSANWYLHSSEGLDCGGDLLSTSFDFGGDWYNVSVPSTVLGALCDAGVYKDPFFGKNLEEIPTDQFENPWWYCTSFDLPDFNAGREQTRLCFDGINYRANVWLNGRMIISADTAFGAFRQFSHDITRIAKASANKLAIEVIPPVAGDFYMGFVDWAPVPPDHNMGIFRQVHVKRSGKASFDKPFVTTGVDTAALKEAFVSIATGITNHSEESKKLTLEASLEGILLRDEFTVAPGQTLQAGFSHEKFKELIIREPRLWWPNGLGKPELYTLHLALKEGNMVCDTVSVRFGMRQIDTYLNEKGVRGYKVNGRYVLIKSAGWVDDLFLRDNTRTNQAQVRYVREMNLNSLRFEGFWGNSREIYDLCDENGILLMVGWSCQWEWPDYLGLPLEVKEEDQNIPINEGTELYGVKLRPEEETLLSDMFRDQVLWLRNHPSIFVWAVGSDAMPKPSLEKRYRQTLANYDPSRSLLVSAGEFTSTISGVTGMKMNGPYEYVPPIYWYEDKTLGGAFGFNTETGPGPQIPPVSSIRRMIPADDIWPPMNDMWNFHSGRKDFNSVKVYLNAMDQRYGTSRNIEELAMKAQWMNYEAIRPMFEAFVVNRPVATGVVQWQLNSAWPEFYWQLYDSYLMPNGAYFGTKKACQPVNIIYNYDDRKVYVANDVRGNLEDVTAKLHLFDRQSNVVFAHTSKISLQENTNVALLELPKLAANGTFFLKLALYDAENRLIADNFYWLSGKEDQMDWKQYFWYYTPQKEYADLKGLNNLPAAQVNASKYVWKENGEWVVELALHNTTPHIAFALELLLTNDKGEPVLPVFWDDNYVSLTGNERKDITVRCSLEDCSREPSVMIQGINIQQVKL